MEELIDEATTLQYQSEQTQSGQQSEQPQTEQQQSASDQSQTADERTKALTRTTMELMVNLLHSLGCQPQPGEDGSLQVKYQGENFSMQFSGYYARVWDAYWAGIHVDDPNMPKLREAANIANFNFGPTIVMTAPDQNGVIVFHTRHDIMLHPACPDNKQYIKSVLDSFFEAKENFRNGISQIEALQAQAGRSRRPVGFSTPDQQS